MLKKRLKKTFYLLKPFSIRNHRTIILVYSMGKVGSSTIYELLRKTYPCLHVFHVHFLSKNNLENILPAISSKYHWNIGNGKRILEFIRNHPKYPIKIITLVRDPISRDISGIFQNWEAKINNTDYTEVDAEELCRYLDTKDQSYTLSWFDSEFKDYLNFDIYSHTFDKQKGYSIYSHGNVDILCLKLERLDEIYEEAIESFLGKNSIVMKKYNLSVQKKTASLYKELTAKYKADNKKLRAVYDSKFVRHFYTEKEIDAYMDRWSHGQCSLNK